MSSGDPARRLLDALATFDEIVELDPLPREERLAAISDPSLRRAVVDLIAADAQVDVRLAHIDRAIGPAGGSVRNADPLNLVGSTVSHFRVVELLASGGMGVVYRAEDTRLQRTIALKFPLPTQHVEPSSRRRFLQEARIAGGLDHPNLCTIYETGETEEGYLFYAMPLYQGETLKQRLAREGALLIADALEIARQISLGVSAAHRAGIVHRDLKPANVMLQPDGTVKVLDFGLAKTRDLTLTDPQLTLGTVAYMAPEQITEKTVDGRADLWALGVMLYEMVTGRRPFKGVQAVAVAHAIVHADPLPLTTPRGDEPPELEPLISALLRKDPVERLASFEALLQGLESIQSGRRLSMQLPSPPHSRRMGGRGMARLVAVTGSALLVIGVGAWFAVRPAAAPAEPRRVAVLPLMDSSDSSGLAAALGDAINSELARIRALAVPSYSSMLMYGGATSPLSQAAADLGVNALVGVRLHRIGDGIRGEVHIIDGRTGKAVWSRRYDSTTALDLQREVTQAAVARLRAPLSDIERRLLTLPVTSSARAYDLYLQARSLELELLPRVSDFSVRSLESDDATRQAQALYVQAIALDPSFARAHARLALSHSISATNYDTLEVRRERARLEAETALRLEPLLFEGHQALGAYWARRSDWANHVEAMERAVRLAPNHGERHVDLGRAYRDAGRWDEAIASFERSFGLDPHNSFAFQDAAAIYRRMRRVDDAFRALDRAIELRPADPYLRVDKGYTYLSMWGIADSLESALNALPPDWNPAGMATFARAYALRAQRRYAEALATLDDSVEISPRITLLPRSLMRAELYRALGRRNPARAEYQAARASLAAAVALDSGDAGRRFALAQAYVGLGRREAALREANLAMQTLTERRQGPAPAMSHAVEVFAQAGDFDTAFELLELLLTMPGPRVHFVRMWPGYDPLRADPRFEQLLERYAGR